MPREKTYVIRRAAQLEALNSPVRLRIVELLAAQGPCAVRELAARMGRIPEGLYYHMRALASVGLVVVDKKRKAGRRTEAVYRLVAPRLVIDPTRRSEAYTQAMTGSAAALLRLAERDYRAAVRRGDIILDGPKRNLIAHRFSVRLTKTELAKLNRLLEQLAQLLGHEREPDTGSLYALTTVLVPLVDSPSPGGCADGNGGGCCDASGIREYVADDARSEYRHRRFYPGE